MKLAIDVQGLNKSFGTHRAVKDVSIQVIEGHICGFLGPNGSGKTTTLRMLCGLLTPDSGSGKVLGLDFPREAEAIKRQTGARGLRAIMEEVLMSVMYDIPSRGDVATCTITEQVVRERVYPTIVPRDAATPTRTTRERRDKSA